MPAEALRATDRIHRQIEAMFLQSGLYYDRRKGFYKDEGKPIAKIVPVVELLQAMLAIALMRPDDARARPQDYIKDDHQYELIFGEDKFDLTIYVKCLLLFRRAAAFLAGADIIHQRNIKFYLAMYIAAAAVKHAYIPPSKLIRIDVAKLDDIFIADCYGRVRRKYDTVANKYTTNGGWDFDAMAKGPELLKVINADLRRRFTPRKRK
jgi:hypothetical protein